MASSGSTVVEGGSLDCGGGVGGGGGGGVGGGGGGGGGGSGTPASMMDTRAVEGVPRAAPKLGLLNATLNVRLPVAWPSLRIRTVKLLVASPTPNESVPLVAR